MMPPANVPHKLPVPPITAASNAKMSCNEPDIRVEIRSQREKQTGEADGDKRNRRGHRVDKSRIDADELDGVRILSRGANLASKRSVGEE